MSTGISITSINRIKKLAEEKRFAEALEILDTQNLEKSINPQFLRISGEIFRENKRYYDSRKILLKSHQMSPQGIRIIYELIRLYLELGYFTKAKIYYEQYKFYSTEEDTQKDYVEYMMRKAEGADLKELSAILLPILERMPEDRWNFEAVLLYDKLDRKDRALEECKYILENFKDSVYVDAIVQYIDDELDIEQCFYVFPKEEQEEDIELYGDLIEQEEIILQADHLRMYPPEARIMVEAEDEDSIDLIPIKDKKINFSILKKNKSKEDKKQFNGEDADLNMDDASAINTPDSENIEKKDVEHRNNDVKIKKEREAILDKILSKKFDKDKIKESAKQVAKAVKEIDKEKAKTQAKTVALSVKDNVIKAKDVLEEAVGAKPLVEDIPTDANKEINFNPTNEIVDAIIDDMVDEPKKVIGEVVMNEELDALVPDSLEAMSPEEIADIELKKAEAERIELEALEAELNRKSNTASKEENQNELIKETDDEVNTEETKSLDDEVNIEEMESLDDEENLKELDSLDDEVNKHKSNDDSIYKTQKFDNEIISSSYEKEKAKYISHNKDEVKPLDSLGFITVVQSDVDQTIEDAIPDTANMLHQMIDNKEFYQGKDSTQFESKESYENHGFVVENCDFDVYRYDNGGEFKKPKEIKRDEGLKESLSVEAIYAEETIVDFDDIIPSKEVKVNENKDEQSISEFEEPTIIGEETNMLDEEDVKEAIDIRQTIKEYIAITNSMQEKLLQLKGSR